MDTAATPDHNAFLAALDEEARLMREFHALLLEEQQVLLGQDGERVLSLAEQKTALVARLGELAERRRRTLAALPDEPDTTRWLERHAPQQLAMWRALQQLAQEAQQINLTNGKLINIKLRSNRQMLSALYNAAQHTSIDLYGRDGQQSVTGLGRSLGSV